MAAIILRSLLNKKVKQIHAQLLHNSWLCLTLMNLNVANKMRC